MDKAKNEELGFGLEIVENDDENEEEYSQQSGGDTLRLFRKETREMKENLLSLFAGIGLVALLVIAGFGTADTKRQEVKAATETTIATTESKNESEEKDTTENMKESTSGNSGATTAEKSEANTEEVFSNGNTKDTINMNTVTDFEVDGNTLIIYKNDVIAYEWER